jgi:Zn finger protein HypA/HybF involved in hydrogenase expression
MPKPLFTGYTSRSGEKLFKPSIENVMALSHLGQGFCLACADSVDNVEPDASKIVCPSCDARKVYGAEELALMGLTY